MPLETPVSAPPLLSVDKAALAKSSPRVQSAARWFWWIAGLSVINSVIIHTGGDFNFVVGLGFMQLIDGLFQNVKALAFLFDALAAAFFFFAGFFALRGHLWAFVVGGIAYVCDGAIYALVGDWLPVGFHVFALFSIFNGAKELRAQIQQAQQSPPPREASPALPEPAVAKTR